MVGVSDRILTGEIMGVRGVVIDGAIRDIDDIKASGFPSFSRHVVPNAGEPRGAQVPTSRRYATKLS